MATGGELVLRKAGGCSLKEEMARVVLRNIQNKGHPYVELRENGKRFIFFCTLCLAPCYGETSLLNHLNGNLHAQRYAGAKLTLFGPNPWPFDDGVFFFYQVSDNEQHQLTVSNSNIDGVSVANGATRAIMAKDHDKTLEAETNGRVELNGNNDSFSLGPHEVILGLSCNGHDVVVNADDNNRNLVIPGVLVSDEISILGVRFIGYGHIASRILSTSEVAPKIRRIWCAWLGEGNSSDQEMQSAPDCDFSIVTFSYTYNLGRKAVVSDLGLLTSSNLDSEIKTFGSDKKRRRQLFSEAEDIHDSQSNDVGSYGGECLYTHNSSEKTLFREDRSDNVLMSRQCEGQLQETQLVLSRECRRDLRRQQRLAAERDCDVCKQPMLPGKDVATLLNRKTGNLACSSRNTNGAFHVFHTSCLIHWLLLCELEMWTNSTNSNIHGRVNSKSGRKSRGKSSKRRTNVRSFSGTFISSIFCPECQGTGVNINGDELEKPTVPLSEEKVLPLKSMHFYQAVN